jgi:NADH dehydrogenase FAD-containing subunit
LQWNTEVTISSNGQEVSQAYCSALPVAYSTVKQHYWKDFAILILEATYEATFYAALRNYEETGNNKLFLTLVGGGAFGNEMSWILHAIEKAASKFKNTPLDVSIVCYGRSKPLVKRLVELLAG